VNPFIDHRFEQAYASHPIVLVDVGARGGLRKNWRQVQTHLHHIAFEPEPEEHRRLTRSVTSTPYRSTVLGVALHREAGLLDLHVARSGGLSSIFKPDVTFLQSFPASERFETRGVAKVPADSLDNQLKVHQVDDIDFIKIDTQGSELFVLQGASQALESSVIGVEVEVSFTGLYADQPLFANVDALMREAGFYLFDLRPCYWKRRAGAGIGGPRGQIIWADALYLKNPSSLERMIAALPENRRRVKALKAISIALLYGYADFAMELAGKEVPWLGLEERATIESRIAQDLGHSSFSFPGRTLLAAVFHRLWRMCQEPSTGWSVSRSQLGNID
jgi:FkbM family methyltransferase